MPGAIAVLLAAGESRRMGRPKALLPWQGVSLLEHQVSCLRAAGVARVVVVLGHEPDRLSPLLLGQEGVTWVVNPDYAKGKTTSIKTGLNALGPEVSQDLIFLSVDQPRRAGTIRYLLQEHRTRHGLITIPEYLGKGGHPVIVAASLFKELLSIDEATLGLKDVVRRHQKGSRRVKMSSPEVLWDLNTPEQYQAVLQPNL